MTDETVRRYRQALTTYTLGRGLNVIGFLPEGDDPSASTGYLGFYDVQRGVIAYLSRLTQQEQALALTHEVFHSMIRPPSPDAEPYSPNSVPSEERVVNQAASLVCDHFLLGDYRKAMQAHSVPYLNDQTPNELTVASDLAAQLIAELE
jgi:hypothetical protein